MNKIQARNIAKEHLAGLQAFDRYMFNILPTKLYLEWPQDEVDVTPDELHRALRVNHGAIKGRLSSEEVRRQLEEIFAGQPVDEEGIAESGYTPSVRDNLEIARLRQMAAAQVAALKERGTPTPPMGLRARTGCVGAPRGP